MYNFLEDQGNLALLQALQPCLKSPRRTIWCTEIWRELRHLTAWPVGEWNFSGQFQGIKERARPRVLLTCLFTSFTLFWLTVDRLDIERSLSQTWCMPHCEVTFLVDREKVVASIYPHVLYPLTPPPPPQKKTHILVLCTFIPLPSEPINLDPSWFTALESQPHTPSACIWAQDPSRTLSKDRLNNRRLYG